LGHCPSETSAVTAPTTARTEGQLKVATTPGSGGLLVVLNYPGASSSYRHVRAMEVFKCSKCCQLFRLFRGRALFVRGVMNPYFSVGPSKQREALLWLPRRAGSSGILWHIHSLVRKTLHRHRAGFEPQRASPFMKSLKASQILGEAARA
jgi:hypothetical protein